MNQLSATGPAGDIGKASRGKLTLHQGAGNREAGRLALILESKFVAWTALFLVIAGGALARLNHIGKSVWTAEAWVANSVLADSLTHMFRYDAWLQTTPPLFLVLVRTTVQWAGLSVYSLRAVPFGLALCSLVLIAWLGRLTLRTPFAVIGTALVALSPPAVVFSKEVKQYPGDILASCLLLLTLWGYLESPDRKRYILLVLAVTVTLFLSYPAVCFLPAVAWVLIKAQPSPDAAVLTVRKRRFTRVAIVGGLAAIICNLNYWFFVRPNTSALLKDYWADGYPRFGHLKEVVHFYAESFLGMGVYFYLPMGTKDELKSLLSAHSRLLLLLVVIGVVSALWLATAVLRRERGRARLLGLCFAPLVALALLNAFRLYPVNSRRLTIFMLPCISLAIAFVMQSLWERWTAGMRRRNAGVASACLTIACVVVALAAATHSAQWGNYWFEDEDTEGAFKFLQSQTVPEDTIYIHASIAESAKLYFRILRWSPPDVRYGNTGWACCTRNAEPRIGDPQEQRDYVLRDFARLVGAGTRGRLWLVFTTRDDHWNYLGRNEPEIIATYLNRAGCRMELEKRFANEAVDDFVCAQSGRKQMAGVGVDSRGALTRRGTQRGCESHS